MRARRIVVRIYADVGWARRTARRASAAAQAQGGASAAHSPLSWHPLIRNLPRAPVVLAHGLFGFERIGLGRWTLATYFRGIPDYLRALGVRVVVPQVHPTAGIARRARKLGERISAALPDGPFHIIGHSMGGLDARQLLLDPAWAGRVLSLTTVGTPHLGTALAVSARRRLGPVYRLLRAIDWDHQGFLDIEPDAARSWHEETPAPDGVACYSVAGAPGAFDVCWPLRRLHATLEQMEGPNDGLVAVESAEAFGTPLPAWPIDHLRQMNWWTGRPGDALWPRLRRLYALILRTIAQREDAPALVGVGTS
jgi:triacylglycerol lipase